MSRNDLSDTGRWAPQALALLRITTAWQFLWHGAAKLFHVPRVEMFSDLQLFSLLGLAGVLELFGGVLVLIGLFTRPVAFVLSGLMAVAYWMAHAPQGHALIPFMNQGEAAVLFCFVFLLLAAAGPGAWSIDGRRQGARRMVTA